MNMKNQFFTNNILTLSLSSTLNICAFAISSFSPLTSSSKEWSFVINRFIFLYLRYIYNSNLIIINSKTLTWYSCRIYFSNFLWIFVFPKTDFCFAKTNFSTRFLFWQKRKILGKSFSYLRFITFRK